MAATKPQVDEIVGWVDRVYGFSFDGWTHKDFTFRDDCSADFVVRFGNATPRRFVLVSKDAFSTLDYIAVYETTESPAMGKSLDGPLYRRLWARLVCRWRDSNRLRLTDAEREAVEAAIDRFEDWINGFDDEDRAATLRGLLDRIGHQDGSGQATGQAIRKR